MYLKKRAWIRYRNSPGNATRSADRNKYVTISFGGTRENDVRFLFFRNFFKENHLSRNSHNFFRKIQELKYLVNFRIDLKYLILVIRTVRKKNGNLNLSARSKDRPRTCVLNENIKYDIHHFLVTRV